MSEGMRKLVLPIAFLVITLPLGIAAVMAMGGQDEDTEARAPSPFTAIAGKVAPRDVPRAEPRWEQVDMFAGSGAARHPFAISPRAIQWRTDWSCTAGEFELAVARPMQDATQLATSSCPDAGSEISTGHGDGQLQVASTGRWRVVVRQQVDTALREPKLPSMTAAARLTRGRFHRIQKHGEGTVSLYRLANGRLALRFEKFYTAASPGLRLWLSRAPNVSSTLEARRSKYVDVGPLRSTLGSYNHMLPASVRAEQVRTIVVWCPTVLIAFTAAPLR